MSEKGTRTLGIKPHDKENVQGQIQKERGNSYPEGTRGDDSSGLHCLHTVSTAKSEVVVELGVQEELIAFQSGGLNYSPGFTSMVF